MAFKITNGTGLFKQPQRTEENFIEGIASGKVVAFAGKKTDDGWIKVQALSQNDAVWILAADCTEVPDSQLPAPPPVDPEGFVATCLVSEEVLNGIASTAPWFISADFLIARALIETGLVNETVPISRSDGVGPLRVTSEEWTRFLHDGGDYKKDYPADGRTHPTVQVRGAAWTTYVQSKAISDIKGQKDVTAGTRTVDDTKKDPFIPSLLDVFHAYLINSPEAAVAILEALVANRDQALKEVVKDQLSSDRVDKLFVGRVGFNNVVVPAKVGDFANATQTALGKALIDAFELIKRFEPGEVPPITAGGAPWRAIARDAMARGVSEASANDEIVTYFKSTDLRPIPASSATPWCGAFAAFCMQKSGNPTVAASVPKGSAAAVSWKNWGAMLSSGSTTPIPQGAVVVLSPSPGSTGGSGHVGFFVAMVNNGAQVKLLGGNQSNKATETNFNASLIAAVRWLDFAPAVAAADGLHLPNDIKPENRPNADLIVNAFAKAGFGRFQQLAAVANAIAESRLDPKAHAQGEDSVGLFQCRRVKGLGGNHSVEELQDPAFNTQLIIAEAKKFPSFVNATDLKTAVSEFVRKIERPADPTGQSASRFQIAQAL